MKTPSPSQPPRFLRVRQIVAPHGLLPIGRSTWFAWIKAGRAPAGIRLSPGVTVWSAEEVLALAERQPT